MVYLRNIENYFIWFILIALLSYNGLNFQKSISFMVPIPEGLCDEMDYFTDAKSFYLTNSLYTTFSLDESVSKIGGSGGHGFTYALFYGTIQKLLQGSNLTIIFSNLTALLLVISYLYIQPYRLLIKNTITALILSYFITINFLNVYLVEILNISFSLFLSLYLYRLYDCTDEKEKRKRTWIFFLLVLGCSTFRYTYVFFLFGLIPLADTKRKILFYSCIIVIGIAYSLTYINLFLANSFHPARSSIYMLLHGGDGRIAAAFNISMENLISFFRYDISMPKYLFYYKYVLITLSALQLYFYTLSKNKLYLAPFFISIVYLASVCLLYTGENDLQDHRHLSEVFILNITLFAMLNKKVINYALLTLALLSIPEIHKEVQANGDQRLKYYKYFSNNAIGQNQYHSIKKYKTEKDIITVQLPHKGLYNDLYFMPLISDEGKPIRYNIAYAKAAPEKSLFITHYWGKSDTK